MHPRGAQSEEINAAARENPLGQFGAVFGWANRPEVAQVVLELAQA